MIADDPTTPGGIAPRQVLDTYVRHTNELFDLYVDGEVISTTGEHPFWVPDTGWVKAKDLQIGTTLQTEDGRIIDVDGVAKREGEFTVYNLKVDDFHTYYVSDLELLVHNADNYAGSGFPSPQRYPNTYGGNVRFDWPPVGGNPLPPTVTVGQGSSGELILDHINKRGYPDGAGIGSQMVAEAAQQIGLPRPTRITATNIINTETTDALKAGVPAEQTKIGQLLQNAAIQLGGTPGSVRSFQKPGGQTWMEVDISY